MLIALIRNRLDPWLARPDPSAPRLAEVRDLSIPAADRTIPARLYRPSQDAQDLLVFFHGGDLVSSSLATHDAACRRLADGTGFNVLAVDYRLAPEARYPAAHDDAEAALAWSGALGFTGRLFAGGDSAGGLLALAAMRRQARAGRRPVEGVALFYPLLAMDPVEGDPRLFRRSRAWMRRQILPEGETGEALDLHPLRPLPPDLPPLFIASGGRDPTRLDALRLIAQLGTDAAVTHHLEPRATHGFLNLASVWPRARAQAERTVAALRAAFAP